MQIKSWSKPSKATEAVLAPDKSEKDKPAKDVVEVKKQTIEIPKDKKYYG